MSRPYCVPHIVLPIAQTSCFLAVATPASISSSCAQRVGPIEHRFRVQCSLALPPAFLPARLLRPRRALPRLVLSSGNLPDVLRRRHVFFSDKTTTHTFTITPFFVYFFFFARLGRVLLPCISKSSHDALSERFQDMRDATTQAEKCAAAKRWQRVQEYAEENFSSLVKSRCGIPEAPCTL